MGISYEQNYNAQALNAREDFIPENLPTVQHVQIDFGLKQRSQTQGHPETWVLAWGVVRLVGGGSGLTSPLGSVLSQCTVRYRPSFAVQGIYPVVQLHAHLVGTGIMNLCIV